MRPLPSKSFVISILLIHSAVAASGCGGCDLFSEPVGQPTNLRYELEPFNTEAGEFRGVSLYWQGVDRASAYELERADVDDEVDFRQIHRGDRWDFVDDGRDLPGGFIPGRNYVYRVRAHNGKAGSWSSELEVEVPPFLPPKNVTATYMESGRLVRIEWDAVDVEGVRYEVVRGDHLHGHYHRVGEVDGALAPMFEDHASFERDQTYYYRVLARHDLYGETALSLVASIDTPPVPTPVMVDASQGEADSILVRWTPIEGAEYRILRAEGAPERDGSYSGGDFQSIQPDGDYVTHRDANVEIGKWYYYKVTARLDWTESDPSPDYVAGYAGEHSPDDAPPAPGDLRAEPAGGAIGVHWQHVSTANLYRIYRLAADEELDPNTAGTDPSGFGILHELTAESVAWSSRASYNDHGTEEGRVYYYYATAVNEHGESTPSEVRSAKRGDGEIPGRPAINVSDGDYSDAIVVSWSAVTQGDWYQVYTVQATGGTSQIIETVSDWIRETGFVHFTASDTRLAVRARSNKGVEGPLSNAEHGRVDSSSPEYTDPVDPPPGDFDYDYLGEVPASSGAGVVLAVDGAYSDGSVYVATSEDSAFVHEYGRPGVAELSGGEWQALADPPEEILDSNLVRTNIAVAAGGGKLYFSALDEDTAYVYELHDGSWSENLAAGHFGYEEKPSFVTIAVHDDQPHVAIVTPDEGNLRVLHRSGSDWVGAGGDGYLSSDEPVADIAIDAFGDTLYVIHGVVDTGAEEATLRIHGLQGGGWQTLLDYTGEYTDVPVERSRIAAAPDGAVYFMHWYPRGIYRVSSPSSIESVRPDWCQDPFAITVDSWSNLYAACMFFDLDADPDDDEHYPIYQVVGAYDGIEWKETGADFRGKWRPVALVPGGDEVYFIYGDFDSLPPDRNLPTVMRSMLLSPK